MFPGGGGGGGSSRHLIEKPPLDPPFYTGRYSIPPKLQGRRALPLGMPRALLRLRRP